MTERVVAVKTGVKTKNFLDPLKIFQEVGVEQGTAVADFGCGSGYIALPLARYVTERGKVYAIDIMKDSLTLVHDKALQQGNRNVQTVWADLEVSGGTKISPASLDMVFLKDNYFQLEKPIEVLREAVRVLKKGGKLIVIDWKKGKGPIGPPEELRKDEAEVVKQVEGVGLSQEKSFDVDLYHFGYIFTK
jgi:ubiquinone/menaquinone biosynthesis C-methylase UbiE